MSGPGFILTFVFSQVTLQGGPAARLAGLLRSFSSINRAFRNVDSSGRASGPPNNVVSSHPSCVATASVMGNGPSSLSARAQRKVPNNCGLTTQHLLRRQGVIPPLLHTPPALATRLHPHRPGATPRRDASPEFGSRPPVPGPRSWQPKRGTTPTTTLHSALPSLDSHSGSRQRITTVISPRAPADKIC